MSFIGTLESSFNLKLQPDAPQYCSTEAKTAVALNDSNLREVAGLLAFKDGCFMAICNGHLWRKPRHSLKMEGCCV